MRTRLPLLLLLLPVAAVLLTVTMPGEAEACGGFFCNAGTQSPIYQAGERVVFAPSEAGGVTMHIEIAFEGEPTDFGWILPIEPPTTADGSIPPIEEILGISTAALFDQLQAVTDPQFQINADFSEMHSCNDDRSFSNGADAQSTSFDAFPQDASAGGGPPPVAVLSEANVGPYGAQLIQATDAEALYTWLNDNGYLQDPAARPLLTHYVGKGFVFVGLRLQSGAATGDIRPVELTLGETYACVPLRLTSIAATADMPMLVWVLGAARAVPKNFLHARVNPLAIQWPAATNYTDLVTEAINEIEGRAFVTEFAGDTASLGLSLAGPNVVAAQNQVAAATDLVGLVAALEQNGIVSDPEITEVLQAHIAMPEGLTGYPHGNCYYDPNPWDGIDEFCDDSATHVTTEAEFYGFLAYWAAELETRGTPLDVDLAMLAGDLEGFYFAPRERIQALFAANPWITRFYTTVSPADMTRDPIFAFNADLPPVDRLNQLDAVYRNTPDCQTNWVDTTYPDGRQVRWECGSQSCQRTFAPVPGQPALLKAEVIDESGEAMAFDPAAAEQVDDYLDMAVPGSPSLPVSFVLPEAPAQDQKLFVSTGGEVRDRASESGGCGCTTVNGGSNAPAPLGVSALALLGLGAVWRRRRRNG